MTKSKLMLVRVEPEQLQKLRGIAAGINSTVSFVVRALIDQVPPDRFWVDGTSHGLGHCQCGHKEVK